MVVELNNKLGEVGAIHPAPKVVKTVCKPFSLHGSSCAANKYNYNKVKYIGSRLKIKITCPKHGDFMQPPHTNLRGCGCLRCNKVILKDGTICDSQVEAYRYLYHKKNGIPFLHNRRYGRKLGRMRYDFYFPSLNLYEEITSFNLNRNCKSEWLGLEFRKQYLEKINKKKKFVESCGSRFKFVYRILTAKQRQYVHENSKNFIKGKI